MKFWGIILLSFSAFGAAFEKAEDTFTYLIHPHEITGSEITEQQFLTTIHEIHALYFPMSQDLGRPMEIFHDWKMPYFSAWASNLDQVFKINFWGGFARLPSMSIETWEFVVCHEVGHIVGGEPMEDNKLLNDFSAEGQSDYFAITECLPHYYRTFARTQFDRSRSTKFELETCNKRYKNTIDQNICLKTLKAGRDFSHILRESGHTDDPTSYHTPAPHTDETIDSSYPSPQCRLDSFLTGALCLDKECVRDGCWYND